MSNEELVAMIQAGAEERMGELWEQVEQLVKWKANRVMGALEAHGGCGVVFDDLYQSGYPALVEAVETYDPAAGAFSTWFMYYLRKAFAEATGYRTQRERNEPLNNFLSLDTPLTDDANSDTIMEVVADPGSLRGLESVEEAEFRKELHEALETALQTLPDNYREVLRLRYWENLTLEDIGEQRSTSKERIRQMENKAIRQLRKPNIACHLWAFYDFDFYRGTGAGAFQHSGMSIQERYLVIEEDRKERAEQRRKEQAEKQRKERFQSEYEEIMERSMREAQEKVAQMTQEEKRALLEQYGYT